MESTSLHESHPKAPFSTSLVISAGHGKFQMLLGCIFNFAHDGDDQGSKQDVLKVLCLIVCSYMDLSDFYSSHPLNFYSSIQKSMMGPCASNRK